MATCFCAMCGRGCSSTMDQCLHGRPPCCDGAMMLPPSMAHDEHGLHTARCWMHQEPRWASGACQVRGSSEADRQNRKTPEPLANTTAAGRRPRSASSPRVDTRASRNSKPGALSNVSHTHVHHQFAWSERLDCTRSQGPWHHLRVHDAVLWAGTASACQARLYAGPTVGSAALRWTP